LNGQDHTPSLPLLPGEKEEAEAVMKEMAPDFLGLRVGFAPGSVWPTKRWPWEYYAELAGRLIGELPAVVFLVGGSEDAPLGEKIVKKVARRELINLIGKLTLRISAALIDRMDAMVTNDTGLLHVARARGVPTVSIFGATTDRLFHFGQKDRHLTPKIDCHPCTAHGGQRCPEGHFDCMKGIGVDRVYEAVTSILDGPESKT
ncbi:unnamed protein product, partial [marine sediment metagenome]